MKGGDRLGSPGEGTKTEALSPRLQIRLTHFPFLRGSAKLSYARRRRSTGSGERAGANSGGFRIAAHSRSRNDHRAVEGPGSCGTGTDPRRSWWTNVAGAGCGVSEAEVERLLLPE